VNFAGISNLDLKLSNLEIFTSFFTSLLLNNSVFATISGFFP